MILCVPTRWHGRTVLRLAFVNPSTDADRVLEVLRSTTAGRESGARRRRNCQYPWIESSRADQDRSHPSQAAADRRALGRVPGVLRAAGGELLDPDRSAHQRGLRLHLDADQRAARRGADPPRRGLRRVPADVPRRDLPRIQGQSLEDAGRVQGPARPGQRGAQRAEHLLRGEGGLRGRRRDRHPGHPGRGGRFRRADLHRRPRRLPAGHRQRHRALSAQGRLRSGPDDPGRGPGAVLRHPGPLSRSGRPGRRDQRQPARGARGRPEDGGQVARAVRRPGESGRPRRRAQGQGGRGVPGPDRRRAAQPPDQRAGPRSRAAARRSTT